MASSILPCIVKALSVKRDRGCKNDGDRGGGEDDCSDVVRDFEITRLGNKCWTTVARLA